MANNSPSPVFHTSSGGIPTHPLAQKYISERFSGTITTKASESTSNLGWGFKRSGKKAQKRAIKKQQDFLLLEDGFVRSMFPGYEKGSLYSIIGDSRGIYFDSSGKSDLIQFLNQTIEAPSHWAESPDNPAALLEKFRRHHISKYNCYPSYKPSLEPGILVVDQTKGDAAIQYGGLKFEDFDKLLQNAIEENPDDPIYVKTHPDHKFKAKKSCFSATLLGHERVTIIPNHFSPYDCFSIAKKVYVGTSLMGMEALIHEKEVITYGWNFYAGWGLTEDRSTQPAPPRNRTISLLELFETAYLRYSIYFDPDFETPCSLDHIIDHIQLQHRTWEKTPDNYQTLDFNPWKRKLISKYIVPNAANAHLNSKQALPKLDKDEKIIVWGRRKTPSALPEEQLIRIEDGFLNSKGLGAQFHFPYSWVFDDLGIYFDSTKPSRLEFLLENKIFTDTELEEAKKLIEFFRTHKVTKYNLGTEEASLPEAAAGKKVILVPGQVDSDASITYGSPKIKSNKGLLHEVRAQHPDAFICYKPHPDLLAGARFNAPLWEGIHEQIDYLVESGDIITWIHLVDEIHTLTSTVGIEALIQNKPVFTYGIPFYAGWGLTEDWLTTTRRNKKRSLPELVSATYLMYPIYKNPCSDEFTTALKVAHLLTEAKYPSKKRSFLLSTLSNLKATYTKLRKHH